ncbi:tetratricopeptide repeat protein [Luteolibacter soli]|uniref:Tetratricopeptide repeat protein n=1 Tax=Luteolibacter soli TaxID=3135280 RepID=A0ABU9B4X1_9BACT
MQVGNGGAAGNSDLERRFPSMRPVKSPPSLFTINGIGVSMYGKRDFDAVTGTYIKTRCFCLVFIPVFPIDAYRVADAPGRGWYFLGKERVSGFARGTRWCALAVVALFIGSGAWQAHIHSPEYRARKAGERAAGYIASGMPIEAVKVYRGMIQESIGDRAASQQAMLSLLNAELDSGDPNRIAAAVRYADANRMIPGFKQVLIPDLTDRALAAAAKCSDPKDAERILAALRPSPTDLVRVHEALRKALESIHKAEPDNRETRIKLALMREEFGEVDGALALLEPAADKLGDGEGARLYGNLLMGEGRVAEALPHLERYVTPRMAQWKTLESAVDRSYEAAQKKALDRLNRDNGAASFRKRYDAASAQEQERMVQEYLSTEVPKDPDFIASREHYQAEAKIVPSIMDLGVARLRMAQAEKDPAARKELLKKSEEAFLALRSSAGETDEYRLFLGQVYFWSDREPEGRKLFDELLASKKRDVGTLFQLAHIFRDLGETNEARKLLDEAFPKATRNAEKAGIVSLRSLLARDTDEKIEWLSKGNASEPTIAVRLSEARGQKAEEQGDQEAAKRHYRDALAAYEKQERNSTSLNNSALLYRNLYRMEGKLEDFETSARLVSEAVELEPANSILSENAAESQLTAAVIRLAGNRIDPKLLQFDNGLDSLRYLYQREEERDKLLASLTSDPNFRKGIAHYWDALLLSPKNPGLYGWGAQVFAYIGDDASLERLLEKAAGQEFDHTIGRDELARYVNKERDNEVRDALKGQREAVKALVADLKDAKSRAWAQASVATSQLGGFAIGESCDSKSWLGALKSAAKEAPCVRLQTTLEAALQIIALEALAADHPDCAAIIEADRRLLGPQAILRLLVRAKGELGERVRKHPAVVEAREAAVSESELFPGNFGLDDWLLLDGLHPEKDAKLKELATSDRSEHLGRKLERELNHETPAIMLGDFWEKILSGDDQAARKLLPKIEATGVKLPVLF